MHVVVSIGDQHRILELHDSKRYKDCNLVMLVMCHVKHILNDSWSRGIQMRHSKMIFKDFNTIIVVLLSETLTIILKVMSS